MLVVRIMNDLWPNNQLEKNNINFFEELNLFNVFYDYILLKNLFFKIGNTIRKKYQIKVR